MEFVQFAQETWSIMVTMDVPAPLEKFLTVFPAPVNVNPMSYSIQTETAILVAIIKSFQTVSVSVSLDILSTIVEFVSFPVPQMPSPSKEDVLFVL